MSKIADLYILTDFDFSSQSSAAYSRMLNYATLYAKNESSKCYISNIGADYKSCTQIKESVFIDNPTINASKNKLYRTFKSHINLLEVFEYLKKSYSFARTNSNDFVFLIHTGGFSMTLLSLVYLKIIKGAKVIYEKNELVLGIGLNSEFNGFVNLFPLNYFFKAPIVIFSILVDFLTVFYSGIIVISTSLERLYKRFNSNIILVPILVSEEFFNIEKKVTEDNKIIVFSSTGGVLPKKEGIEEFLLILNKLKNKNINFHYNIYGDAPTKFVSKFMNRISELKLSDDVFVLGHVNKDEIKNVLAQSDFLVLTRPKNIQNNFGFSTKLGEYLASGKPVILTDISDNSKYLKDKEDSIFINLKNIDLSANKINNFIENKSSLDEIGKAARINAKKFFINYVYVEKLTKFIIH